MTSIDGEMLSPNHLAALRASAISDDVIAERGYETITNPKALPGTFIDAQRTHGLLLPIRDVTGEIVNYQLKPDNPRIDAKGKPIKYETAKAGRSCIDVPMRVLPYLRDVERTLWITEGPKKVDSGLSHGLTCIIGLTGVWNWLSGKAALPDWREIDLKNRDVVIAFDSDVMTNHKVRGALTQLRDYLAMRGAFVRSLVMLDLPDGAKCGLDDWFASGKTVLDLEACILDTLPGSEYDWEPPMPLEDPTGQEPAADSFPDEVQDVIDAIAVSTQTPRGLGTIFVLAALSAAARGRYEVFLPQHGHAEPAVLHLAAVMEPAERKTAVYNYLTAPLKAWAQERNLQDATPVLEWKSKLEVLEKRHKDTIGAEAAGPRKGKDGTIITDAKALEDNRKSAIQELLDHWKAAVYPTTLLADDITNERIKEVTVQNRGALAVVSDEGTFLEVLAGRFADSARLEMILNGHTGGKVDMQRRTGPPLYWPRGYLTIGLAVQRHVIHAWGATDGVMGKGAAARLMAVFPPSLVGYREHDAPPVSEKQLDCWDSLVRRVLGYDPKQHADTAGYPLPCRLYLATDAYDLYRPHWEAIERNLRPNGTYSEIRDWAGKLHGATLRIAALLHLATEREPDTFKISAITMRRAIDLALWFADHARIMYRVMTTPNGQHEARQVLDAIRDLGTPTTKREVHRRLQDRAAFKKSDNLNEPLALLVDYGWIRTEQNGKSLFVFLNPYETPDNADNGGRSPDETDVSSVLSVFSMKPRKSEPTPIRSEPFAPTGTDGAFPGEFKL